MEEKRFYLTRVKVVSSEGFKYNVGEVYCAIADRYDLEYMSDNSQPYGIIHTPIDAAKVAGIIAEANKEADEKRKAEADTRNEADQTIFACEKAVKDLGEKLTDTEKKETEDLIANLKKALEGTDIDAIKDKTKALNDKAMALATKVYEEAAKTAEANKNNDSSDKNDGAEEAEFVNKD